MTHAEQHKMIVELIDYTHKMKRYDQEEFEMFVKRDKDDEDLDAISQKRLVHLYEFYVVHKGRSS
ncbi:MAG: hypothetical protein O7D34_05455 [Ignavibacteria bacterium]|nr:hypothetical protein [Ignavibacteria bacterium]